ncbi:AAA family ATPase [Acetobacteraceae bacterium KSS8]|uniref:AAA family ATPase n=1 Tax=Endosaccharibacter trunci TaxID=2812733 RepID=A0ABT1W634_9PROT|nr:AAA family ATPase [Acetobacteraceae bacterium KSS8]
MKLRSLSVDQFRRFDRPVRLDGIGDGLNVLCAPNEFGKSTLLAAIRAVLFERHNSRTESIRSYQPRLGSTAPAVSLAFDHDGASHSIEKRFLLRPHARLVSNGVVFEADAAEENLAGLLGVSAARSGARNAARQTASIWDALLVDQGQSFAQAELGDGARATLSACLDAELGAVSGGVAIARLLKPVLAQMAERLDGHGRPRDRYKAALAEVEDAAREGAALQARRHALEDDLSELEAARCALAQASDPRAEAEGRAALAEARRHRDALLGQRDRVRQANAAVELAAEQRRQVRAEIERRAALRGDRDANERALSVLREAEGEALRRLAEAGAAFEAGRSAHADAQQRADAAARAMERLRAQRDETAKHARHRLLRDRLRAAEAETARIADLSARIASTRPDETAIGVLRQLSLADRADRAALLAQATIMSIGLEVPARLERPGVSDIALAPGAQRVELNGPARLVIAGVGAIEIVPAAGDRDRLIEQARTSARALRQALDAAGCADLAEAELRAAERARLVSELGDARRALAHALGPDGLDALRAAEAAARPAGGEKPPPDDAALLEALARAQGEAEAASLAERDLRDALRAPEAARDSARAALAEAELGVRTAEHERLRLAAALDGAERALPDAALAARAETVDHAHTDAATALTALLAAAPEGTVELADARILRLEQAERNRADARTRERERIARLEARIAAEEGAGLDEQIEQAARRGETAARIVSDNEREIAVLTLLRDTLREADRAARERFLAPLIGRISPYLRALFPGADLALDDRFAVSGLVRPQGGAEAEAFGTLSHGTREQVAILARLAFADMLAAGHHPSFLVLDDALAFADADRMDRMFDILHEASRRLQILVLTCRPDVAARLGGHALTLEPAP